METFEQALTKFERAYLMRLLKKAKAHTVKACELSGLGRPQLHRMMKRNKIRIQEMPEPFGFAIPLGPEGWTIFRRKRATQRPSEAH